MSKQIVYKKLLDRLTTITEQQLVPCFKTVNLPPDGEYLDETTLFECAITAEIPESVEIETFIIAADSDGKAESIIYRFTGESAQQLPFNGTTLSDFVNGMNAITPLTLSLCEDLYDGSELVSDVLTPYNYDNFLMMMGGQEPLFLTMGEGSVLSVENGTPNEEVNDFPVQYAVSGELDSFCIAGQPTDTPKILVSPRQLYVSSIPFHKNNNRGDDAVQVIPGRSTQVTGDLVQESFTVRFWFRSPHSMENPDQQLTFNRLFEKYQKVSEIQQGLHNADLSGSVAGGDDNEQNVCSPIVTLIEFTGGSEAQDDATTSPTSPAPTWSFIDSTFTVQYRIVGQTIIPNGVIA